MIHVQALSAKAFSNALEAALGSPRLSRRHCALRDKARMDCRPKLVERGRILCQTETRCQRLGHRGHAGSQMFTQAYVGFLQSVPDREQRTELERWRAAAWHH